MFISASYLGSCATILLLQCVCNSLCLDSECIVTSNPKTRTFNSIQKFQANAISFDPRNEDFAGNFVNFSSLKIPVLIKNDFISLESKYVLKISLDNKGIALIDSFAFLSLDCLQYMQLQCNHISHINRDIFEGLGQLRVLDISKNNIPEIIDDTFINTPELRILNLSFNKLKLLSNDAFTNLSVLEELNLSFNYLHTINGGALKYLINLNQLKLNANNLNHIEPEKWLTLNKLTFLNLASNHLRSFDTTYNFSFIFLTYVNLSQNELSYLNVYSLKKNLPHLKGINLNSNPWNCDDLSYILNGIKDARVNYTGNNISHLGHNIEGISCFVGRSEIYTEKYEQSNYSPAPEMSSTVTVAKNDNAHGKLNSIQQSSLLEEISSLRSLLTYFVIIITVCILIDIGVRTGAFGFIRGYRRDVIVLDNSNIENIALLRA